MYLRDVPAIARGLDHLLFSDPVFSAMEIDRVALDWTRHESGFPGLVRIIAGQQLSIRAADSVWRKLLAAFPDLSAQSVLGAGPEILRSAGLSRQKIVAIEELARTVRDGILDPEELETQEDEKVFSRLTALRGLGPWSAHMYLMFALARPDVWPSGDLGIRKGCALYADRSSSGYAPETVERLFRPHRTAACLLLWTLYAGLKKAEQRF